MNSPAATTLELVYLDLAELLPDTKTPRIINLESDVSVLRRGYEDQVNLGKEMSKAIDKLHEEKAELRERNNKQATTIAELQALLGEDEEESPAPEPTEERDFPRRQTGQALGMWLRNPGNLEVAGFTWKGQVTADVQEKIHPRFCGFIELKWGWRAMAYNLLTYRYKHDRKTIFQVIERWAPSEDDNDVDAYTRMVERETGINRNQHYVFDELESLKKLCLAMGRHEQGKWKNGRGWQVVDDFALDAGVAEAMTDHPLLKTLRELEEDNA